jgi:hypothetical protein
MDAKMIYTSSTRRLRSELSSHIDALESPHGRGGQIVDDDLLKRHAGTPGYRIIRLASNGS